MAPVRDETRDTIAESVAAGVLIVAVAILFVLKCACCGGGQSKPEALVPYNVGASNTTGPEKGEEEEPKASAIEKPEETSRKSTKSSVRPAKREGKSGVDPADELSKKSAEDSVIHGRNLSQVLADIRKAREKLSVPNFDDRTPPNEQPSAPARSSLLPPPSIAAESEPESRTVRTPEPKSRSVARSQLLSSKRTSKSVVSSAPKSTGKAPSELRSVTVTTRSVAESKVSKESPNAKK